jgi:dTDP-4-dehydrorhamnose reductase
LKVLVFGSGGQIGHEVRRAAWPDSVELAALDRNAADVASAPAVNAAIGRERPDRVVNLAAYTAVDRAESEPEAAWEANCAGAAHIAAACGDLATPLIHLSTDYVFDGRKNGPYREDDAVDPLNVYGRSKEAGERAVRAAAPYHVILRTAWVYGSHGANFVKTMLRLGHERPVLRVVADQQGSPTAAADIAAAITAIAALTLRGSLEWGTYHFAAAGSTSWYEFAEEVIGMAEKLGGWAGGTAPRVEAITTAQYPTAAQRPANSVLDCTKIRGLGISPPPWRASLPAVIRELVTAERR